MAIDTTKKIKQVTYNGTEIPLRGYDTSDATVTAGDMAYGVVAYGKDGEIYGGVPTIDGNSEKALGDSTVGFHGGLGKIQLAKRIPRLGMLFREGSTVILRASPSEFGNATAADVAKGKTFTSAAGLNVVGTMEASAGYKVTFPATAKNWHRVSFFAVICANGTIVDGTTYSVIAGQTVEGVIALKCVNRNSYWNLKITLDTGAIASYVNISTNVVSMQLQIVNGPGVVSPPSWDATDCIWLPIADTTISAIEMYTTD